MKVALKLQNDLIVGYIYLSSEDYSKYQDYIILDLTKEQFDNIKVNETHLSNLLVNDFSENIV